MADFKDELTSEYTFNNTTGALIDNKGAHDIAEVNFSVTDRNGNTVDLDGIVDLIQLLFGNVFFTPNLDYTGYLDVIITDDFDTFIRYFFSPQVITNSDGCSLRFRGDGGKRQVDFASHFGAGGVILELLMGRLFNIGERVILFFSYDRTTKTAALVVKSDDPTSPLNLSTSGVATNNPNWTASNTIRIGRQHTAGPFSKYRLKGMGSVDGTAKSIADMQDTADGFLMPVTTEEQIRRGIILQSSPRNS